VQAAGAFFELQRRLGAAPPPYGSAIALPDADRRIVTRPDRRHNPRGGRRMTDLQLSAGA